jgi:tape measure domain-containing protein
VSVVANVAINVDSSGAVSKLRQVQTQAQQTERAFGGVAAAATKLAVALGAIQAARFVFVKTAELESQTRSLQVLTGSAEKAGQIIKELQQLGAVTPFTSTELIDSAKRLQAFGVEADKVVETTRRLADASGATGAELSGLVTAYGQVQAKGRLQGEELLQFQERGIALQQELRKMYGMTGEEFQKALEKGQISAKAVEVALVSLTSVGGKYANGAIAQSDTLQGRLSTLQDGIDGLARGIGTALSPAIKAILNEAIFAVNTINTLIATGARAKNFGLGDSQRKQILNQAQNEAQQIVEGRRIKDPFERNRQFQELAGQRERDLIESYGYRTGQVKPAATAPQMATQVPALLGGGGGGGRAGGGGSSKAASDAKRAADEAAREAQRVADVIKDQQFITQQLEVQLKFANEIFEAEQKGDAIRVLNLQTLEQQVLAENDIAKAMSEEANAAARLAIAAAGRVKLQSITNKGVQDVIALQVQQEKNFDAIIADLELELALKTATTEQAREQLRLANELAGLQGQGFTPEQIGAITAKKTELAAPLTDAQNISATIGKLQDEITQLTSISNIAITAAEGIGNAFAQSFQGLISGTMTAKEALGSFFKSVADMFLEMAAQIIAKQITMIILQTILKALGGAPGGGSSSNAAGFGGSFDAGIPAIGNTTDFSGAFKMRAMGGPVSSQQPYIVGERGPELFVPGTGGSVVNNNDLRSAMGGRPGGANGSTVLNMSFQSTTINGVEYVSRDQLEAAMAQTRRQAAKEGASRGMNMTLDKIQNSPSTRSRVGIR